MRKRIGDFFIDKGILTRSQAEQVVEFSKDSKLRFGEAAIEMGLIRIETMIKLFGPSYRTDFFQLDPEYYPEVTRDLFSKDILIKHGVLPLGFKTEHRFYLSRKMLNLGMLDPNNRGVIAKLEELAKEKTGNEFYGIKSYLIIGDQFLNVIHSIYKVTDEEIRSKNPTEVNETVQLFVDLAIL